MAPPACPQDVTLVKTFGHTEVDPGKAVRIISQNTSTVTVRLFQIWTSVGEADSKVDSIVYNYRHNAFMNKCDEATSVVGGGDYQDITIHCYHHKPIAELDICVADNGGALHSNKDNAEIPNQCCQPGLPDNTPVVCYKVLVNCDTACVDVEE